MSRQIAAWLRRKLFLDEVTHLGITLYQAHP